MDNHRDGNNNPTASPYRDVDVLLGRQKFCRENGGNRLLKQLVEERADEYDMADKSTDYLDVGMKKNKLDIKLEIVAAIHGTGGRFLRYVKKENRWREVSEKSAIEKVKDRFTAARKAQGPARRDDLLEQMLGAGTRNEEMNSGIPVPVPSNPVSAQRAPASDRSVPNSVEVPVPIAVPSSATAIDASQTPQEERQKLLTPSSKAEGWDGLSDASPPPQTRQPPNKVLQLGSTVATPFTLTASVGQHFHEKLLQKLHRSPLSITSRAKERVRKRHQVASLSEQLSATRRRVKARSLLVGQADDMLNVLAGISSMILGTTDLHRSSHDVPLSLQSCAISNVDRTNIPRGAAPAIATRQEEASSPSHNIELLSEVSTAIFESGASASVVSEMDDRKTRNLTKATMIEGTIPSSNCKSDTTARGIMSCSRNLKTTGHVSLSPATYAIDGAHDITFPSSILMTTSKGPTKLSHTSPGFAVMTTKPKFATALNFWPNLVTPDASTSSDMMTLNDIAKPTGMVTNGCSSGWQGLEILGEIATKQKRLDTLT